MRTSFSEKSLFGFVPMEYDYLKARKFWLWAALIFSYLEKHNWNIDLWMMISECKLKKDFLNKRLVMLWEKWLLVWVWEANSYWVYNKYKIIDDVLRIRWNTRIRK